MSSRNDAILDAAAELIRRDGGVRRLRLSDVARQAGVSRPTVYRRWPDVHAVVSALLIRRLQDIQPSLDGSDRAALVGTIVATAVRIRDDEVLSRVSLSDLATQAGYADALRIAITHGQRAGTIRPGRADRLATMVLLITQSTAQSNRLVTAVLPDRAWRRELATALDGYLRPC
jgi:AcrR family transcriptional regulator